MDFVDFVYLSLEEPFDFFVGDFTGFFVLGEDFVAYVDLFDRPSAVFCLDSGSCYEALTGCVYGSLDGTSNRI
ncbi:hypothetical protein J2Z48_003141 [Croceifilum oryzae]|uniref:Uncharacterized protein n=1 Tax=Croceifilum oryzae TaxID=1553429 RepID=A0AAJ1TR25_9BACL|nr:hypothetical protein [Croceifilum oryzae]